MSKIKPRTDIRIVTAWKKHLSVGEVAELLGTQAWRVARLYQLGLIAEPPRVAGRRIVPNSDLAEIAMQLQARGWLSKSEVPPS